MYVKIAMRFFTFWTAFDFRLFVIIKKERFPNSTECFEKYSFLMIKKAGGLVILKKVKVYMKTVCNMGENGLVISVVFFGTPLKCLCEGNCFV